VVDAAPPHRSGVVALLGRPNAGKSSLLNRLIGAKLAIVTPKPQTTRGRLLGVLTLEGAQVLLHDTPGIHPGRGELHAAMQRAAAEAAEGCDLALILVDGTRGWEPAHDALAARLAVPWLAVRTKLDLARAPKGPWPPPATAGASGQLEVSAATGQGIDALLREVVARLPEGPAFYPPDDLTDRSLRFLAAELVREAAFGLLEEELPYSIAVEVEEFDEKTRPDLVRIRANLLVARASQKRIVIGSGGEMIREIGTRARRGIEQLLERRVHLELWVKIEPGWAKRRRRVEGLGYV